MGRPPPPAHPSRSPASAALTPVQNSLKALPRDSFERTDLATPVPSGRPLWRSGLAAEGTEPRPWQAPAEPDPVSCRRLASPLWFSHHGATRFLPPETSLLGVPLIILDPLEKSPIPQGPLLQPPSPYWSPALGQKNRFTPLRQHLNTSWHSRPTPAEPKADTAHLCGFLSTAEHISQHATGAWVFLNDQMKWMAKTNSFLKQSKLSEPHTVLYGYRNHQFCT